MAAKTNAFFLLLAERGSNSTGDLPYAKTIPNKAAKENTKNISSNNLSTLLPCSVYYKFIRINCFTTFLFICILHFNVDCFVDIWFYNTLINYS